MIDNINLIKPLLKFNDKEEVFFMLYILKRKKDFPDHLKNAVQSVRTIKSYCITSLKYLDDRYEEIKMLCEIFQARAYIHVCSQNHKDVALNMINEIINRVKANQHNQKNVFDSVVGQLKVNEKRWVVDLDKNDMDEIEFMDLIGGVSHTIDNYCQPIEKEVKYRYFIDEQIEIIETDKIISKVITSIPTKNGVHLITKPFNIEEFKKSFPTIDVQKKNPTLLYLPNSLENI